MYAERVSNFENNNFKMGKGGKGKGKGKGKGGKGKGKGGDVHIKRLGNKRFFVKGAGLGLDSGDIANLAKDLTGYEGYVCEVVDFSDNHLTDRAVDELVRVLLGVRIEIISFKLFKNKISDAGAKSSEQKRKKNKFLCGLTYLYDFYFQSAERTAGIRMRRHAQEAQLLRNPGLQ